MKRPIHTITRFGERNVFFQHRTIAEVVAAGEWPVSSFAHHLLYAQPHRASAPRSVVEPVAAVTGSAAAAVAREGGG